MKQPLVTEWCLDEDSEEDDETTLAAQEETEERSASAVARLVCVLERDAHGLR